MLNLTSLLKRRGRVNLTFYSASKKFFPRAVKKAKETKLEEQEQYQDKSSKSSLETENEQPLSSKKKITTPQDLAERRRVFENQEDGWEEKGPNPKEEFDPKYNEYFMSRFTNAVLEMPEDMQVMAHRVFSKHEAREVREWSRKLMLRYSQTHATEGPTNLNIIPKGKLFSNSEELSIPTKLFSEKKREEVEEKEKEEDQILEIKQQQSKKENFSKFKVVYERAHVIGYLLGRMPFTYYVHMRIFKELTLRMPDFKPKTVLDFGSGLGSGVWAVIDTFKDDVEKIAAVEPNKDMRRLGKFLSSEKNSEILWVESLTMIPGTGSEKGKFDLIILGYVLQELQTSRQRLLVIEMLWNRLNQNGVLVVIEPGSPKGFRFIHDLRKWILDKPRSEASIIAPCSHHFECPLKSKGWCHFSQMGLKFPNEVFPKLKSENPVINEKFSFLTIKKGETPNAKYENEEDVSKAHEKSFFWSRVIRPTIKRHQHVIVDLCTPQGRIERRIISKSQINEGGYKNARHLRWGELWYIPRWLPNKFRKETRKGPRLW